MSMHLGRLAVAFAAVSLFAAPALADGTKPANAADPKVSAAGEPAYLKVELENVQITSYQLGVLDNGAAAEGITIAHEGFEIQ